MNNILLVTDDPSRLRRAVKNDGEWSLTEIDLTGLEIVTIDVDPSMAEHLDLMLYTIQLNLNH
jgi:hypothetical protein